MGLISKFFNRSNNETHQSVFALTSNEIKVKALLIEHAIDLIAKTISKSEIEVFAKNNEGKSITNVRDDIYYTLNVRPNSNEDGTTFMYNVAYTLLKESEVLVVRLKNDDLVIATRWDKTKEMLKGRTFFNITFSDETGNEYTLNERIHSDDALYMNLGNSKINNTLSDFNKEFANLLIAATQSFKRSNFSKYKLNLPTNNVALRDPETNQPIDMQEYIDTLAGSLLDDEDSVISLPHTYDMEEINTKKVNTSADIRDLMKEYGDYIAMSFNIPLEVFWGNKSSDKSTSTNDFITFGVLPILNVIEDSFNAKLITKESYIAGEEIKFNKLTMKHFDVMDNASAMDKLTAIGWSRNEINKIIGVPIIHEEWANRHYVTKNYMDVNKVEDVDGKGV